MPIYIGDTLIPESGGNINIGGTEVSQVYVGSTLVWQATAALTAWNQDAWTGSNATGLNAAGDTLTGGSLGNASSRVLTNSPGSNSGASKTVPVTYTLGRPDSTYTPSTFSITHNVTQASGQVAYTVAQAEANITFNVFQSGTVSLGVIGTLNNANYVNGQSLGTVSEPTFRTLTGNYVVPSGYTNTGSTLPISITVTQAKTVPAFVFSDTNTNNVLTIDRRTGVLSGVGSYSSGYTDAEGNAINFSLTLAPGQTSTFPVIAFGGSSIIQSVSVVVTGEIPDGFLDEAATFSLQGSVSVLQLATDVAPAVPATAAILDQSGEYVAEAGDRVNISVTITPDSNGEWNVTSSNANVTFSGVSGVGSDNFTANVSSTWNGSIIRFTIRSGSSSTGAILANGQIMSSI